MFSTKLLGVGVGATLGLAALLFPANDAHACGCFAPPDPTVPIVQAGERIAFATDGEGNVIAHIQIQYRGEPEDFGWLLPLPSVPELGIGVDELFTQLVATTQPKYRLTQITGDACEFGNGRNAPQSAGGFENDSTNVPPPGPAVVVSSIGPYNYAVLRADSQDEMFNWLRDNRYFIPTGTEDVVAPYIRPGAYFLALQLKKGNNAGDIQPVVLKYQSDRAMIPLILTSVAADPNMGVQVWMLGNARALPVNYFHTILNDEFIDWFGAGQNYNEVIIAATNEAREGQTFVTEYAGDVSPMANVLDWQGRFGAREEFVAETDPGRYAQRMRGVGFRFDTATTNILKSYIPMPDTLRSQGVSEDSYYQSLDYYLIYDRMTRPQIYADVDLDLDSTALTTDLFTRIVEPTLEAGKLFRDHAYMTRLYTTLSADEMTRDPVFGFNPQLQPVSNVHEATFEYQCGSGFDSRSDTPGILGLPDGRRFFVGDQAAWVARDRRGIPYSRRIEILREEGAPEIQVDNTTRITPSENDAELSGCGCSLAGEGTRGSVWSVLTLVGLAFSLQKWARRFRGPR